MLSPWRWCNSLLYMRIAVCWQIRADTEISATNRTYSISNCSTVPVALLGNVRKAWLYEPILSFCIPPQDFFRVLYLTRTKLVHMHASFVRWYHCREVHIFCWIMVTYFKESIDPMKWKTTCSWFFASLPSSHDRTFQEVIVVALSITLSVCLDVCRYDRFI